MMFCAAPGMLFASDFALGVAALGVALGFALAVFEQSVARAARAFAACGFCLELCLKRRAPTRALRLPRNLSRGGGAGGGNALCVLRAVVADASRSAARARRRRALAHAFLQAGGRAVNLCAARAFAVRECAWNGARHRAPGVCREPLWPARCGSGTGGGNAFCLLRAVAAGVSRSFVRASCWRALAHVFRHAGERAANLCAERACAAREFVWNGARRRAPGVCRGAACAAGGPAAATRFASFAQLPPTRLDHLRAHRRRALAQALLQAGERAVNLCAARAFAAREFVWNGARRRAPGVCRGAACAAAGPAAATRFAHLAQLPPTCLDQLRACAAVARLRFHLQEDTP